MPRHRILSPITPAPLVTALLTILKTLHTTDWQLNTTPQCGPLQLTLLRLLHEAPKHTLSPTACATHLAVTFQTAAQALRTLQRKQLVTLTPSPLHSRHVAGTLTAQGLKLVQRHALKNPVATAIQRALSTAEQHQTLALLERLHQHLMLEPIPPVVPAPKRP